MIRIELPDPCVVMLIGASGSGKSTFAARHFPPSATLSSDAFRAMLTDDESDLTANEDVFETLNFVLAKRLQRMRLTVVDATHLSRRGREEVIRVAHQHDLFTVAIVLDTPLATCLERNAARTDRSVPERVIRRHVEDVRLLTPSTLKRERIRYSHIIRPDDEVEIVRQPLHANRRGELGPFDLIGDVHGCFEELVELLIKLGYEVRDGLITAAPLGRRVVFLGDLVDRGPMTPEVLDLAMHAVEAGVALCVPGNHDVKLARALRGAQVKLTHGIQDSLDQLAARDAAYHARVADFLTDLTSHLILDEGRLVVAHAGMKEEYQGRSSRRVRSFALYGETTGESDEFGLPVRLDWAAQYRGTAAVVYGHTPMLEAQWHNNTICLDTGCVFGGKLTAMRWPERELIDVPARRTYFEPIRPLAGADPEAAPDVLDLRDVLGDRRITTRTDGIVKVSAEQSAAALEVMSRFAVPPRWLPYLPPTMSPTETSERPGLLEHPDEAFAYFARNDVAEVVCEEKHMGSRAVLVLARDADAAAARFGAQDGRIGVIYTRTGRPFFADPAMEEAALRRVHAAVDTAGLWASLNADWLCLDAEIMPWSMKAQALLRSQYAAVGAAADVSLNAAHAVLQQAAARGLDVAALLDRNAEHSANIAAFRAAYRAYCWDVASLDDVRIAPFHVLAAGDAVWFDTSHRQHLQVIDALCDQDPLFQRTQRRFVALDDAAAREDATTWWAELTANGGEGMVVKPIEFSVRGPRGFVQPGLKVRGPQYLRLIYGPDYTAPHNLERLRKRAVSRKRTLARREFALGREALERFARRDPLRLVHECVFGVLALESTPIDPRL